MLVLPVHCCRNKHPQLINWGSEPAANRRLLLAEKNADVHAQLQLQSIEQSLKKMSETDPEIKALLEGADTKTDDEDMLRLKKQFVLKTLKDIEELRIIASSRDTINQPLTPTDKSPIGHVTDRVMKVFNVKAEMSQDMDDEGGKRQKVVFRDKVISNYENRIRSYSTPDKIFRYFATLSVSDEKGRTEVMMTPKDFLRSLTPGSKQPEHLCLDKFDTVPYDIAMTMDYGIDASSIFHQLGAGGLISFSDYIFLLTVLSTSKRHFEIAFKMFDLNGDGNVDSKEFENVANLMRGQSSSGARHRDRPGATRPKTGSSSKKINSGLMNYFFGEAWDGILTLDKFLEFQRRLQNEILKLEFDRQVDPKKLIDPLREPKISERDFAELLIAYAGFPEKKKAKMIKRVKKAFGDGIGDGGVSLTDYLNFFQVLCTINDIDTALTFYNIAGAPIERSTMKHVAQTVAGVQLSDHVVDVVFLLFDENGDGKLSNREFISVMKQRAMRGLEKPKNTGIGKIFSALTKCATTTTQPAILGGHRKTE